MVSTVHLERCEMSKNKKRARFVYFFVLILSAAVCGCSASAPRVQAGSIPRVLSFDQAELASGKLLGNTGLLVETIQFDKNPGACCTVSVVVRNHSTETAQVSYRFRWFEPSGFEARNAANVAWTDLHLEPQKTAYLSGISPAAQATAFKLELQVAPRQ